MKKFLSLLLSIAMVFSCLSCLTIISVGATQDRTSYFNKNYTLTGNPIDDIVAVAQAQANRTKAQMGYTEAWCANFVGDCASLAGLGDIIPRNGYCGTLYSNILNAGGKEVTTPQKGDIIFYYCTASSCPNSGKPWVHVGIMTSPTSSIEGNSGGKVAVKSKVTYTDMNGHTYGHSGTNSVIAKYLRPNYPSQEPEDNYVDLGTDFYAYIEHQNTGLFLTNQNTNVAGETPTGKSNQIWKFIRQPNGSYALQSNLNGYYMDVYALDEDNANVYTWSEYLNTSNQQFYIYYEYGAYYFRPAHSTTRRLDMSLTADHNLSIWGAGEDWAPQEFNIIKIDVNGNLPIDMGTEFYSYIEHQGTGLYLTNQNTNAAGESPTGNQNQIWKFVRQANGAYSIQSVSNGYYLDVYGSFDENDTNVYTWNEYTGATNQQFYIYYMYAAHYIRPAFTESKMLDMSTVDNNLEIWACGSDWAPQEFNIIKIDVLKNLPITLGDNFYARIENIATHKVLSVVGNNVEGLDKNCDKQQIWNFIRQPNNSYKIISCVDSGAMDVQDYAVTGSGTNIQINVNWDTTAQLFFIYDMYDSLYIKPQCSDMVLDMSQTTYNLEVWDAGEDWPAQKFSIEKIERDEIGVHNYTSRVSESATCTTTGTEIFTCSVCGDTYTETIPTTGHTEAIDEAVTPDCENTGLTEGKHCSVCDKVLIEQEVVDVLGHTEVADKGFEATYEKVGLTDGSHCSVCDKVLVEQEIIPILVMIGDVDGDGKVSIMDATEIQRHIAQLTTISDDRLTCADTDKDGKVSIMDATQIQRFIAQLIPEL